MTLHLADHRVRGCVHACVHMRAHAPMHMHVYVKHCVLCLSYICVILCFLIWSIYVSSKKQSYSSVKLSSVL